mgnify:CR=1 FL=1
MSALDREAEADADAEVDRLIEDAVNAATGDVRGVLELVRSRPDISIGLWLDALALQFGADALRVKPSGDAAERLVVDAYRRFLALAERPVGRGERTGKFAADRQFNQRRFMERIALELNGGHPFTGDKERSNAKRRLTRWCSKHEAQ